MFWDPTEEFEYLSFPVVSVVDLGEFVGLGDFEELPGWNFWVSQILMGTTR